jgi:hypothetical protein
VTFSIDVSGADALAASFDAAGRSIKKDAAAVVSRGALNVKRQMQDELKGSPHFRKAAPAVSYDLDGTEAEIGPEIGRAAGSLAWIAAFGTGRTPAWWDFTKAARDEAPNLERFLADAAEKAL